MWDRGSNIKDDLREKFSVVYEIFDGSSSFFLVTCRSAGLRLPSELRDRPDEAADPSGEGERRRGGGREQHYLAGDGSDRLVGPIAVRES